jgi:HrpA-like RNA helicase
VKEIDFDTDLQMSALVMKKASKDSLRQRKGRAGRVQVNLVFNEL